MTNQTHAQLKSIIDRIERLEEEKRALADDIKDLYKEAKGNGFDTKALRKIISLRRVPEHQRAEADAILDTYMAAIGMLPQYDEPNGAKPAYRVALEKFSDLVSQETAAAGLEAATATGELLAMAAVAPDRDVFAQFERPNVVADPLA